MFAQPGIFNPAAPKLPGEQKVLGVSYSKTKTCTIVNGRLHKVQSFSELEMKV